ncbi:MAG: translation initiation factor IF-3 [Coriobacteriales bacterium]|jgi:translation initiation factor IF-3|nr:translation initiation factor IF-3 [Coriobacteriales bacterium]
MSQNNAPRLNNAIRAEQVRLIDADGNQRGIVDLKEALRQAHNSSMDLVEMAANARPPVVKIMNYGKYKYDQAMKQKMARKNQHKVEIKEMKFRPKIDTGDYETKKKHILRFLDQGCKVKVTIMFRGREMSRPQSGLAILEKLSGDLEGIAAVENAPKLEGRNMHMLIAPLAAAKKRNEKGAEQKQAAQTEGLAAEEKGSNQHAENEHA